MGSFLGGRSDRWEYWTSVALLTVAGVVLPMLHVRAAVAALFVMWMVTWARRLHDIGVSGWMALIPGAAIIAPVVIGLLVGGAEFRHVLAAWTSNGGSRVSQSDMALLGFILLSALIQYAFTIWLGIKAGNPEANRFGEPHRPRIAEAKK